MQVRRAKIEEIDDIMRIYAAARRYMADTGNASQWGTSYPAQDIIEADIRSGCCYVGAYDDVIHFVFALFEGEDPTYLQIEGAWLNDEPYITVHRMASDGFRGGVFAECMDFCRAKCRNIRIDTHENNATMRHLLAKNGFVECGVIHLKNGSPRIAYQFVRGD